MKSFSLLSILTIVLTSASAFSMQMGNVSMGGNGCFGASSLVEVNGEPGRYAFPIRVRVNKKSETTFDRKTCNIRLPISLAPNEKVQLVNLSQVVRAVGYAGADVKSNLNMSFAGRSAEALVFETKITADEPSVIEILKNDGVVAESACGKDAMLTGNLSILVHGAGSQAFITTGSAMLTLKVVTCN